MIAKHNLSLTNTANKTRTKIIYKLESFQSLRNVTCLVSRIHVVSMYEIQGEVFISLRFKTMLFTFSFCINNCT